MGVFQVLAVLGTQPVGGSPWGLTVRAAELCASQSTLYGSGISSSMVAPKHSSFTIQSRDAFGNPRTTPTTPASLFAVRLRRQSDGITLPPVHASFDPDPMDGSSPGTYSIPSNPDPRQAPMLLHASLAKVWTSVQVLRVVLALLGHRLQV